MCWSAAPPVRLNIFSHGPAAEEESSVFYPRSVIRFIQQQSVAIRKTLNTKIACLFFDHCLCWLLPADFSCPYLFPISLVSLVALHATVLRNSQLGIVVRQWFFSWFDIPVESSVINSSCRSVQLVRMRCGIVDKLLFIFLLDIHWQCGDLHEPIQVPAHLHAWQSGGVSQQELLWAQSTHVSSSHILFKCT